MQRRNVHQLYFIFYLFIYFLLTFFSFCFAIFVFLRYTQQDVDDSIPFMLHQKMRKFLGTRAKSSFPWSTTLSHLVHCEPCLALGRLGHSLRAYAGSLVAWCPIFRASHIRCLSSCFEPQCLSGPPYSRSKQRQNNIMSTTVLYLRLVLKPNSSCKTNGKK